MDSPDEEELSAIRTALSGGPREFEPLVRRFGLRVFAVTFSVLGNRVEAEDAAQDTFLKAYQKRTGLREPEKFTSWLAAIARHQALDHLRRRRFVPLTAEAGDQLVDETFSQPGEQADTAENHERIRTILATLPERHRLALTLRYLEGHDCRTIENTMALSNGALRGILGRALAAMREGLRLHPQKV